MISHYLLETQQRATMFTFNCLIVARYSRTLFCKNSLCTAFFVTSGFVCLADCSRLSRVLECSHKHTTTTWLTEYNIRQWHNADSVQSQDKHTPTHVQYTLSQMTVQDGVLWHSSVAWTQLYWYLRYHL